MLTYDRAADKAEAPEKVRRVVLLRASWETQDNLREWAKGLGFDLAWSHSGWPQSSYEFDFHVTLVASANAVRIPDGIRLVDPVMVEPAGFAVLGVDGEVPVISLAQHKTLNAMREFFVESYGMKPTFEDFKPHISLSYKWAGNPSIAELAHVVPPFPLVFDMLMVAQLDDKPATKDAASPSVRVLSHADRATISGTRRTSDGYLVTEARVARGGNVQDYMGFEIGVNENRVFKVWRPADEVFKRDTLASFAHKPVTLDHPESGVSPENFRDEAIGHLGSEVIRDGEFVRVPLVVMDGNAIAAVEGGKREISMGYDCELVMEEGTTPDGRHYDAYQRNIRINHCAIVQAGRAGPQCRIGDQRMRTPQPPKGNTEMNKTVTVDGKQIEVTADVAAVIEGLQSQVVDLKAENGKVVDTAKQLADVVEKHTAVKTSEISDLQAKVADLEKQVPTADALQQLADERASLIADAKLVAADLDCKSKDAATIKKEAITAHYGDAAKIDGKSDEYVSAVFDMLVQSAKDGSTTDPIRDTIKSGDTGKKVSPRDAYLADLGNAWKGA